MRILQFFNLLIRDRRFHLLVIIALLAWGAFALMRHWRPLNQVRIQQEKFIRVLENRDGKGSLKLTADSYADRFDFNRDDLALSITDVAGQFLVLIIHPEDQTMHLDNDKKRVRVTARLRLEGKPMGPLGSVIISEANKLKSPFVFTWEKQGSMPWSPWKLISIDNQSLPPNLYNYQPGDIHRAMEAMQNL